MSASSEADKRIYLHYTQAELDRNFDQRGWVSNAAEVIARYPRLAAATRRRLKHHSNLRYGPSDDEVLDVFSCGRMQAPTQIFVHGGAWRNFTKDDYSFVAEGFVAHGINSVIVNFTKAPHARLPDVVTQIQRAITWVAGHAAQWSGHREKLYIGGQSSGAHLACAAITWHWPPNGLGADAIRGAYLVSGCYDLEPVLLSARSSYIRLSKQEAIELSPLHQLEHLNSEVYLAYAENDTDEFQRQSRVFAEALKAAGRLITIECLPTLNHFEIVEAFNDPHSALTTAVTRQILHSK
jgi:arylformamidase